MGQLAVILFYVVQAGDTYVAAFSWELSWAWKLKNGLTHMSEALMRSVRWEVLVFLLCSFSLSLRSLGLQ